MRAHERGQGFAPAVSPRITGNRTPTDKELDTLPSILAMIVRGVSHEHETVAPQELAVRCKNDRAHLIA